MKKRLTPEQRADLRERLAALAHQEWVDVTSHFLTHLTAQTLIGWNELCQIPYDELTAHQKASCRESADKTLRLLREFWEEEAPQEGPAECSPWRRWICDDCNEYFWVRRFVAGGLVCPFCCCTVAHAVPFN